MSEYNYYLYVDLGSDYGILVPASSEQFENVLDVANRHNVKLNTDVFDFVGRVEYYSDVNGQKKLIAVKSLK